MRLMAQRYRNLPYPLYSLFQFILSLRAANPKTFAKVVEANFALLFRFVAVDLRESRADFASTVDCLAIPNVSAERMKTLKAVYNETKAAGPSAVRAVF